MSKNNRTCPTTEPMTLRDIGIWFDAEGSAYISKKRTYVRITQSETPILHQICDTLRKEGIVKECEVVKPNKYTPYIEIPKGDQEPFLEAIKPYIRTEKKCKQIDDVLRVRRAIRKKKKA